MTDAAVCLNQTKNSIARKKQGSNISASQMEEHAAKSVWQFFFSFFIQFIAGAASAIVAAAKNMNF